MYRPGKQNTQADALTRREQDVGPQDELKAQYRTRALLQPDQLDPAILAKLPNNEMLAIETEELDEPIGLIDQIITANRTVKSLEALRVQARAGDADLKLEDGLLLYRDRLIVPDTNNLRTDLIREAHEQVSTAHPGRTKTIQLLANCYY